MVLCVLLFSSGLLRMKTSYVLILEQLMFFYRLQELTVCSEDNADVHDIELLQYISVDCAKLKRILQGKP